MKNVQIRESAKEAGVKLWEIADRLGMTDSSFIRKLRRDLPADEQEKIAGIIEALAVEREGA